MLEEMHVHNYAIIDNLQVRFAPGLNVLTGETGAGKSILIGALGLLLGDRADTSIIRSGAEETAVSGVVTVHEPEAEAASWLTDRGVEAEDGAVILRRVLKANGRGQAFIQSVPVTRADLAAFAGILFDVHGQHEHQSLLDLEQHRRFLDHHGGTEELAGRFHALYVSLAGVRERLASLASDERERLRRRELLAFAVEEIRGLALAPGEQEELEKELAILSHHEKLFRLLADFHEVTGGDAGALAKLRSARHALEETIGIDPSLSKAAHQLEDAFYEIEDVAETVRQYRERAAFSPERLDQVQERLAAIRAAERKYGDTIEAVLAYGQTAEQELAAMENWEEERERLDKERTRLEGELATAGRELSERRIVAARALGSAIEAELHHLGMPKAGFRVLVQRAVASSSGSAAPGAPGPSAGDTTPVATPWGLDSVEFVISPNPGEPFKRLRSIASGGELSRVMLAIKGVLSSSDRKSTLIFDEVDAGIGGEVALAVGERLAALARGKQVLCVTHLATIAVRADNHLRIEKAMVAGRTVTRVDRVTGEARRGEIARMLAGDRTGEVALGHARELLERYGKRGPEPSDAAPVARGSGRTRGSARGERPA